MDYVICRLCLNVTSDQTWKLLDNNCDILYKIRSCLVLDLPLNKGLPNEVCKECAHKVEEINEFCIKVKENEQKLQQYLKNGSLSDYFTRLINVKEENNVHIVYDKNTKNIELNNSNVIEKDSKEIFNKSEVIKAEEDLINNGFNETYSSDEEDNITLSSLKQEKGLENKTDDKIYDNSTNNKNNAIDISKENLIEQFNCLTCDEVCESHNKLREHYKVSHTKKNDEITNPTYTEKVINGKVMYKCDSCDKVYSKKYIKRHTYYHTNERPYVCKLCARTYKTVSDIMRHGIRAHSGLKLLCTYKCGFSTAYTGALKDHEDKVHKNMYKYTCDKCGKGFTVKTWFDQHQNVHMGVKPFVCDICGAAFHMDKYLTSHRSAMHPQSLSKKPLICLHCDLKCDSVNTLAVHLENEHGVSKMKSRSMKKETLCDFCGKILNRPEQLLFHRRMHLGEKPYKCSICGASFARKFSMRVHERAHSRARTHICAPCGRAYSQPSALYRHQRLHHGLARKRAW